MSFYEIPLKSRFVCISTRGARLFDKKKYLEVDGVGLLVEYDNEDELTAENIRRHFILVTDSSCVVEAENITDAIRKFHENWDGANIGGNEEIAKALWINTTKPIIGIPYCRFLRVSDEDRFICGEQVRGECYGERGMCVLEPAIDPPEAGNCPIYDFDYKFLLDKGKLVIEKVNINEREYLFVDSNKK